VNREADRVNNLSRAAPIGCPAGPSLFRWSDRGVVRATTPDGYKLRTRFWDHVDDYRVGYGLESNLHPTHHHISISRRDKKRPTDAETDWILNIFGLERATEDPDGQGTEPHIRHFWLPV
jgi:hypothetical protein